MSNTYRLALVYVADGREPSAVWDKTGWNDYSTPNARKVAKRINRRAARRQQRHISREALVNYYDDLSWIEKLEAELYDSFGDDYESWEDASMYDLTWEDTEVDLLDSDIFDDWTGALEYEWLDRERGYA